VARAAALLPEQAGEGSELTVREVVRTGRYAHVGALGRESDADRAAIARALTALKLDALADRPIDALSAGERKRALVARCFAQEAPLLALDEPTSTLDAGHARALFDAIRARVQDGAGALVAMHDLALAAATADRVIALSGGAIVASGPPAEVLREEVLETLFGARGRVELDDTEVRLSWRR
jgi:iron complex transport system ATP-binding protein